MKPHRQLFTGVLGIAALTAIAGCRDAVAPTAHSPRTVAYSPQILDGAHGGNKAVFFLPPMVSNPSGQPGFGDPVRGDLTVSYKILRLLKPGSTECGSQNMLIKQFSGVPFLTDHYQADWHTDESNLNPNCTYRIEVFVSNNANSPGQMEAFADVDVVSSGSQLKRVDTDEFIPLLDGRTLPIKVRIENGVTFCTDAHCVSEVVPNNTTTTVATTDSNAAAQFPPNWFNPAQVGSNQVIVTIEDVTSQVTGEGKQGCGLGLTRMVSPDAHCVRFSTEPRVTSTTAEITVMVCQEDRGDKTQLLLKYDVDEAPKFLRNVPPPFNCPEAPPTGIGATPLGRVLHLASGALTRAVRSVIGPRTAYAFDLGVGGSIGIGDGFSVIATGHPLRMAAFSELDQTGTAGQIVSSTPTVQLVNLHRESETDPVGPNDAVVTCTVIGENGTLVDEGDVRQARAFHGTEDEDGVYHCPSWRIALGSNVLEVTSDNIDDVVVVPGAEEPINTKVRFTATGINNPPDLLISDVSLSPTSQNPQQPVTLSFSVRNAGGDMPANTSSSVVVAFSYDQVLSSDDFRFSPVHLDPISHGSGASITLAPRVPPDRNFVNQYILIVADPDGTLNEGNEANNLATVPITVTDGNPDLSISSIGTASPAMFCPNEPNTTGVVTLSGFNVENFGYGTSGPWGYRIFLSPLQAFDLNATTLRRIADQTSLGVLGGVRFDALNITLPPNLAEGDWAIGPEAFTQTKTDANPANNYSYAVIRVVAADVPLYVTSDAAKVTVNVGQTYQPTVAVHCSRAPQGVTYSSSNTQVATVDASTGLVTGVSAGQAIITVRSVTDLARPAQFEVTVVPPIGDN